MYVHIMSINARSYNEHQCTAARSNNSRNLFRDPQNPTSESLLEALQRI